MNESPAHQKLIEFRNNLYQLFPKRPDVIMNLLDAISSYAHDCKSVVSLSEATAFTRQYSSITDAIADGLPSAQWDEIKQLVYQTFNADKEEATHLHRFVLDCTGNPRPYAKTCSDRSINHAPNPTPGNKPIAVGHQYSVIAALPNNEMVASKHWVLPVSALRINSACKGHEEGMKQLSDTLRTLNLGDQLSMSIGDSLYGTQHCRESAVGISNHIHLFRLNSTRNIYSCVEEDLSHEKKGQGRPKRYGKKVNLKNLHEQINPDESTTTSFTSAKGKHYTVRISMWKDKLLRGTHEFKSFEHPINVICFEVVDEAGAALFKNKCWVAVLGERRHEINAIAAYKHYRSRYDIEHFFRFAKNNLLMNQYQTPDTEHEASWWSLCLLAYAQLYFSKDLVKAAAKKWEQYLPTFKNCDNTLYSPSLTQRGFSKLLTSIDTPARPCIIRGIPAGRLLGDMQLKRARQPIIFKTKITTKKQHETINPGPEQVPNSTEPKIIKELVDLAIKYLKKMDVSIVKYCDLLLKQPITV